MKNDDWRLFYHPTPAPPLGDGRGVKLVASPVRRSPPFSGEGQGWGPHASYIPFRSAGFTLLPSGAPLPSQGRGRGGVSPSVRRSRPIGGGLGRGPHLASSPICLAFFFSSSMSASRSLGTRLSSTASLRHCFSAPTSMPGLRWNISMISLPLMHGCRSRL